MRGFDLPMAAIDRQQTFRRSLVRGRLVRPSAMSHEVLPVFFKVTSRSIRKT